MFSRRRCVCRSLPRFCVCVWVRVLEQCEIAARNEFQYGRIAVTHNNFDLIANYCNVSQPTLNKYTVNAHTIEPLGERGDGNECDASQIDMNALCGAPANTVEHTKKSTITLSRCGLARSVSAAHNSQYMRAPTYAFMGNYNISSNAHVRNASKLVHLIVA